MLTCKQIHKALANGDYKDLPRMQQWALRMHVSMCFICRRFNRDIMLFQDTARSFREHEENRGGGERLPDNARDRIQKTVAEAANTPSS
jgi:hypothetical protein